jgi:hypothetical protein
LLDRFSFCQSQFFNIVILQAFAWFSDLLVEHSEIFWSLFAVDMDNILAEQPPDTWDSFPLFQILNDYLRTDGIPKLFTNSYSFIEKSADNNKPIMSSS